MASDDQTPARILACVAVTHIRRPGEPLRLAVDYLALDGAMSSGRKELTIGPTPAAAFPSAICTALAAALGLPYSVHDIALM